MASLTEPGRADYLAGNAHFTAGRIEEAIASYDRAVAADPNNATYRYNRGLALMVRTHYQQAIEDLHVALELEPDKADVRFLLGEIRARLGEKALALANYQESLARDPTFQPARTAIERLSSTGPPDQTGERSDRPTLRQTSEKPSPREPEEAPLDLPTVAELVRTASDESNVVAIEHALHAYPPSGDKRSILKRAVLLSALHRREAGASWERAMGFWGPRAELLERATRAYYEAGEWDEILRLAGPLSSPPTQEIARLWAHALQASGRSKEAIALLKQIPDPSEHTLLALAGLHLAVGEQTLACAVAKKAAECGLRTHETTLSAIADRSWFSSHRPLDDLAGLDGLKAQVRERVVLPLLVPELYLSGPISNKFLMMGPPGCGKTTIARVAAIEAGARLKTIHLTSILNLFTGNSEANLTSLFVEAKDAAREGPVILLVDEVDSIAVRRETMVQAGEHRLVNHFMDELDQIRGFPGLVVLAATNLPFDIDSAVLRSGRLGSPLYVGPPDTRARRRLLAYHLARYPDDGIDLDRLAIDLESYSPADIEQAFATVQYARSARRLSGKAEPLTEAEIRSAFDEIAPSVRNWFVRVLERIRMDPSVEGLISGDLRRDLDEFQTKTEKDRAGRDTKSSMFR